MSWQSSNWPLIFDIGVLADAVMFALTYYLFLAFPSGRLRTTTNRLLMGAIVLAILAFFVPWVLLSPVIGGGGPSAGCVPALPTEPAAGGNGS